MESSEALHFGNPRTFDITISSDGHSFAGSVNVSRHSVELRVAADEFADRKLSLPQHLDEIICFGRNFTILLVSLKCHEHHGKWIGGSNSVRRTEVRYVAQMAVWSECTSQQYWSFHRAKISASFISAWAGFTSIQNELLNPKYFDPNQPISTPLTEFEVTAQQGGWFALRYLVNTTYASPARELKLSLTPVIDLKFESPAVVAELFHHIKKVYELLSFLAGHYICIDIIKLESERDQAFLFFPIPERARNGNDILMPLGKGIESYQNPYLPFPVSTISEYFLKYGKENLLISKYVAINSLPQSEDRFLGLFRLLEKCCHQKAEYVDSTRLSELLTRAKPFLVKRLNAKAQDVKSLIGRINNVNQAKYNTASCIGKFLRSLPAPFQEDLHFKGDDIKKICDLRNDLVHANIFTASETEIYFYTLFVNALLVVKICLELGMTEELAVYYASRTPNFHDLELAD